MSRLSGLVAAVEEETTARPPLLEALVDCSDLVPRVVLGTTLEI